MYSPNEQFAAMNKANYENALRMASVSLEKAERYTKLNLHAAKVMLELSAQTGSAVAGIKDAKGMEALRGKLSELGVHNAMAYSRGVYQICIGDAD
jgi:hypothetical protein